MGSVEGKAKGPRFSKYLQCSRAHGTLEPGEDLAWDLGKSFLLNDLFSNEYMEMHLEKHLPDRSTGNWHAYSRQSSHPGVKAPGRKAFLKEMWWNWNLKDESKLTGKHVEKRAFCRENSLFKDTEGQWKGLVLSGTRLHYVRLGQKGWWGQVTKSLVWQQKSVPYSNSSGQHQRMPINQGVEGVHMLLERPLWLPFEGPTEGGVRGWDQPEHQWVSSTEKRWSTV